MKTRNLIQSTMLALSLLALLLTATTVCACTEYDLSGTDAAVDVDSDWKGWTLTVNAFSWPEEKRTAEELRVAFPSLPTSKTALMALCDKGDGLKQRITSPHMAAALCYAALCNYKKNPAAAKAMYRWLKGPDGVLVDEWQNISRRLGEKQYITFALFEGATPLNNYTPSVPYVCRPFTQSQGNGYTAYGTYTESNGVVYCKVFINSGGADRPVPIMTKFHRASGNWFISGSAMVALTDIRQPAVQGGGW